MRTVVHGCKSGSCQEGAEIADFGWSSDDTKKMKGNRKAGAKEETTMLHIV